MPLTRPFKELVQKRVRRDPAFREALLAEAINELLSGDFEVGKVILRDFINATIGFEKLAKATGAPSKSLMRMFSPKGNPSSRNLNAVISHLQKVNGLSLEVRSAS
ncbi:MAG: transcriptional regulator [Proteobacteria bacterium]|nr:transcriptional regulator [Pseudomonadota bacterium]